MAWTKPFVTVLTAALLLCPSSSPAWAQGPQPAKDGPGTGEEVAAGFSNVLYVPGKAIVCTTSGILWIATMALTLGALYNEAANFVKGGCGGKWIVARDDIHFSRQSPLGVRPDAPLGRGTPPPLVEEITGDEQDHGTDHDRPDCALPDHAGDRDDDDQDASQDCDDPEVLHSDPPAGWTTHQTSRSSR